MFPLFKVAKVINELIKPLLKPKEFEDNFFFFEQLNDY